MNLAEAYAALASPLVFANERQLLAKKFIEDVSAAHMRLLACRVCHGEGVIHTERARRAEQCLCLEPYARDVIEACGITYVALRGEELAEKRRRQMRIIS